jgi:hypothetical protein
MIATANACKQRINKIHGNHLTMFPRVLFSYNIRDRFCDGVVFLFIYFAYPLAFAATVEILYHENKGLVTDIEN